MIIQNAILIKETGEIVPSLHVHHFNSRGLSNGEFIAVDGGNDYLRRAGDITGRDIRWEDISLTDETPFEEVCEKMIWGTNGKSGKEKTRWVFLKDCEKDHLQAILDYKFSNKKLSLLQTLVIKYWIEKRNENSIRKL